MKAPGNTFCLAVLILLLGFLLLRPMSSSLLRYMVWRVTSAVAEASGNVTVDGAVIHYVSYGTGPAMLLLHGGLSNRLAWFSQIPEFVAGGRQVVVMDVRGHGSSGLGGKELNYRLLARDAIQVLNRLKIRKADVVGWSDGGNTALVLGKEWSGHIRKIVAISANYQPSGLSPDALSDTYTRSRGPVYSLKRWWTGAGDHFAMLENRVKRMWRKYPVLQAADLEGIEAPALLIVGRHDIVSIHHAKTMAELLPHAMLIILPGGHATPVTHSVQVNEAIAKFLGFAREKPSGGSDARSNNP